MSEYQYYEFVAIDQPLSQEQMARLRSYSSRAEITPTRFVNYYDWGNFKGDEDEWMQNYFDAHIYFANWLTCNFYLRVPRGTFDHKTVSAFETQEVLTFQKTATHWVIKWQLTESENYERFGEEDGTGWMRRLLPLRDELLSGDLRPLYLGWLAGVAAHEVNDKESEPPPPPGLSCLTTAQQALAAFLDIDQDLLTAIRKASKEISPLPASHEDEQLEVWIAELSEKEGRAILKQLLSGHALQAERQIKNRYLAWQRQQRPEQEVTPHLRTVAELWSLAGTERNIRMEKEAEQRRKQELERQAERRAYLQSLAADFNRSWQAAEEKAMRGSGYAFDEVSRLIFDLSEAYALCATRQDFDQAFQRFMINNGKRKALVQRLVNARLWSGKA